MRCHSVAGGDRSKLNVIGRCSDESLFRLWTIFMTESTHLRIDLQFSLTTLRKSSSFSSRLESRSKS